MRGTMRGESGQATIEWTGLLLLVAVALAALGHLAPRADGEELGSTLARSVTTSAKRADAPPARAREVGVRPTRGSAPLSRGPAPLPRAPGSALRVEAGISPLPQLPASMRRAGRGVGAAWRKAWFACLVYERIRYASRHPESRIPGYTLPYGTAFRMISNCLSPIDLLGDLPELDPSP